MSFKDLVLEKAKEIPKGKITTYKLLAIACKHPKSSRAVGNALNKNTWSYLSNISECKKIPCHRVICNNGRIGGFSKGVGKKIVLLKREGIQVQNGRVLDFENKLFKF